MAVLLLQVGGYSGDAGNAWGNGDHNGKPFSTYDNDNDNHDGNCASEYKGQRGQFNVLFFAVYLL